MITNEELESMRNTVEDTFDLELTRLVKSTVSDGKGGRTVTWISSGTFSARLSTNPPTRFQNIETGQVISESTYLLIYPYDQALSAEDRVSDGTNTYEVLAVFNKSSIDIHGRATLKRLS